MFTKPSKIGLYLLLFTLGISLHPIYPVHADPTSTPNIRYPRASLSICGETIITYPLAQGMASISALAFGPDGALYLARPSNNEIARLAPGSDGFIPASIPYDKAQVFAATLPEPPN